MRVTVKEPATLLAFLKSKMPEASTTKLRSLLKFRSILVDGEPQVVANTPDEFRRFIQQDSERWARAIREAKIEKQ